MKKAYAAFAALPLLLTIGLGLPAPTADFASLDPEGDPLRATFNADLGKVRVLMLVAPT